ncbi:hypothetical protein D0Y65_053514 [Glycine soja]|uniref:Uncharacterized protein n=1 Tax=Glycine soja TaxID=3848 RepID=A0A445F267_GLYSO|nr:hypothetical protein D0Y65_053514 [Glycine soja]
MTIRLRDNSNSDIIMTVWKDYAIQLHDAINKNHMLKEPLIVMLSLGKIKDVTDKYPLSVQNIKYGSRLYVNTDITEIQEFCDRLATRSRYFHPVLMKYKTWAVRFKYRSQLRQSYVLDVSEEPHHIQTLTTTFGLKGEASIGKEGVVEPESSPSSYHPTVGILF